MYSVHLIYNGKILPAQVVHAKAEYVELTVKEAEDFKLGDYISFLDLNRKLEMRVIHIEGNKLSLYPSNSDIFLINTQAPAGNTGVAHDERRRFIRFAVETNATMVAASDNFPVKVVDVSRQGLGFVSSRNDLTQGMEFDCELVTNTKLIYPKVVIRNRIPMEVDTRYGAEIIHIDSEDLHALRYFIVTQQLKMMS